MSQILRNGFRFVGATKYIKINTKNNQQSMCSYLVNRFNNTAKNLTTRDQLYYYGCKRLQHSQALTNYYLLKKLIAASEALNKNEKDEMINKLKLTTKISTYKLLLDGGQIIVKTEEGDDACIFNDTSVLKLNGNLCKYLVYKSAAKQDDQINESISSEMDGFNASFKNNKLILKSINGIIYTISQTTYIKVEKIFNKKLQKNADKQKNDISKLIVTFDPIKHVDKIPKENIGHVLDNNIDSSPVVRECKFSEKFGLGKEPLLIRVLPSTHSSINFVRSCEKVTFTTSEGDESLSIFNTIEIRVRRSLIKFLQQKTAAAVKKALGFDMYQKNVSKKCVLKVNSGYIMLNDQQDGEFSKNDNVYVAIEDDEDCPGVAVIAEN